MGVGRMHRSSTWTEVFAIARPIGTVTASSATRSTSCHVANVVVSVGPYTWSNRRGAPASRIRRTHFGSTASPPNSTTSTVAKAAGRSAAIRLRSAVVTNATVIDRSARNRANRSGRSAVSSSTPTSRAPLSNAPQISKVAASNEQFDRWTIRSSGPICR